MKYSGVASGSHLYEMASFKSKGKTGITDHQSSFKDIHKENKMESQQNI